MPLISNLSRVVLLPVGDLTCWKAADCLGVYIIGGSGNSSIRLTTVLSVPIVIKLLLILLALFSFVLRKGFSTVGRLEASIDGWSTSWNPFARGFFLLAGDDSTDSAACCFSCMLKVEGFLLIFLSTFLLNTVDELLPAFWFDN